MKRGKVKEAVPSPAPEAGALDPAEVRFLLGPHGPIAHRLPGYEVRAGQLQLAEAVATAFVEGGEDLLPPRPCRQSPLPS